MPHSPSSPSRLLAAPLVSAALLAGLSTAVLAAPGDPDLTFGVNGSVAGAATAIAVQSDQKILAVQGQQLFRLLPDGSPDLTFGAPGSETSPAGRITVPERFKLSDGPRAVFLLPDGKILLAGTLDPGLDGLTWMAALRLLPDGKADTALDTDGMISIVQSPYTAWDGGGGTTRASVDQGHAIAALPDGTIIMTGVADLPNRDGGPTVETTIGIFAPGTGENKSFREGQPAGPRFEALTTLANGDIAIAAVAQYVPKLYIVQVRTSPGDSLNPRRMTWSLPNDEPFSLTLPWRPYALAARADGSLVITGEKAFRGFFLGGISSPGAETYTVPALVTGSLPPWTWTNNVALQADGRIITTGDTLRRFHPAGTRDADFLAPPLAGQGALAIQADGKILVAGSAALYRLESTGALAEVAVEQPAGTDLTDNASTVDFGNVVKGSTAARTFTIKNPSAVALAVHGVTIEGPSAAVMTVTASPPISIPAGGQGAFTVTFAPVIHGPASATLRLGSHDLDESSFDITLTGMATAVGPEISVDTAEGTVLPVTGTTAWLSPFRPQVTWTVRNIGTGTLTGLALTKTGENPGDFTVTPDLPGSLGPGVSVQVTAVFSGLATATDVRTAGLRITGNDADEPATEIALRGNPSAGKMAWRESWFGTVEEGMTASDFADPDGDGVYNVLEYALQTRPDQAGDFGGELKVAGASMLYTYTRPTAALEEFTYTFQWTDDLTKQTWNTPAVTTIESDDGIFQKVRVILPVVTPGQRFVRMKVDRKP